MHDRPRSSRQSQDRSRRACMPSPPRLLLSESPGIERRFSGRRGLGRRTEVAARRGSARRRGHRSCAVKYGCSAARSTATICSSVNRLFLMRSIAGREPSSQESMERKKKGRSRQRWARTSTHHAPAVPGVMGVLDRARCPLARRADVMTTARNEGVA